MKLVGATNWFIRVPFMLEGLVQGLLGAVVAIISLAIFKPFFEGWLPKANEIPLVSGFTVSGPGLFGIYALIAVVGALVGTLGAGVAVTRVAPSPDSRKPSAMAVAMCLAPPLAPVAPPAAPAQPGALAMLRRAPVPSARPTGATARW